MWGNLKSSTKSIIHNIDYKHYSNQFEILLCKVGEV